MRPILAGLGALSMTSGCSFLFVQPPRNEYGGPRAGNCTASQVAPLVDTLFVLTNVSAAVYVGTEDHVTNKGTAVGVGLGVAAIWLSSAIYGYYNTNQCTELLGEDDQGPYHRPVPFRPTGYRPPAASRPVIFAPAEETATGEPAQQPVRRQQDDDEPGARQQPDRDDPATGMARSRKGAPQRLDLTPRFGN